MTRLSSQASLNAYQGCPLCSSTDSREIASELRRGIGTVLYCASCDHGYLVNYESIDAKKYYSDLYRQEYSHNADASKTHAEEIFSVYSKFQDSRLQHIIPLVNSSTRLLEVGASAGQFLTHLKGIALELNAIELDKDCCSYLQNQLHIEADSEFLENSRFSANVYDVVCAFQVIEHVEKPVAFLQTLRQATRKGGSIFIEAPNLYDPLLSVWNVPAYHKFFYHSAHLHYFTESSLAKVAIDAGFSPDCIEFIFTQDYNLLNHLHWINTNSPQSDCHLGLSDININGHNDEISSWLTNELVTLNSKYINLLSSMKCTSNILMKIKND